MKREYIRIGLMGSSCSGKTTTAKILANDLGLELQREIESELLSEWILLGKIKDKTDLHPALSKEFQEQALRIREKNSKDIIRGVSDRTAAELLVYNRIYVQPYFPREYGIDFTNRCQEIMRSYSHLFLFPRDILPLEQNKFRTADRNYQREIHNSLIQGLGELNIQYHPLSSDKLSIDERVEEVKQCLRI